MRTLGPIFKGSGNKIIGFSFTLACLSQHFHRMGIFNCYNNICTHFRRVISIKDAKDLSISDTHLSYKPTEQILKNVGEIFYATPFIQRHSFVITSWPFDARL